VSVVLAGGDNGTELSLFSVSRSVS